MKIFIATGNEVNVAFNKASTAFIVEVIRHKSSKYFNVKMLKNYKIACQRMKIDIQNCLLIINYVAKKIYLYRRAYLR